MADNANLYAAAQPASDAAVAAVAAPVATAAPVAMKTEPAAAPAPPAASDTKKMADSDSDDENDNVPLSRAFGGAAVAAMAKAAASAPAKPAASSSSSSSVQVGPSAAAAAVSAAAAKRKREPKSKPEKKAKSTPSRTSAAVAAATMNNSDDEMESEDDAPKKKAPKKKGKKAAAADDDDEEDGGGGGGGDDDDDDDEPKTKKSKAEASTKMADMLRSQDEYEMMTEQKPLVPTEGANKWWNREVKKVKWETLLHNGVLFHAPYVPHGVKLKYDGKEVDLNPDEEEVATFYAAMITTDFAKNAKFNANFFRDWTKILKKSGKDKVIRDLTKCDFKDIYDFLQRDREEKKLARKDAALRKKTKKEKDEMNDVFGYAIVDGYREKVANYKVEPPGLFRGRGDHPKTGTLKRRIRPEDVTINIGKGQKIPKAPEGTKWKGVIHNQAVTWLAYYNDTFNDFKYIWLAASSRFKGQSDLLKYQKARKLKDHIAGIRENYKKEMEHKNSAVRQRATAIYLIDVLALRVGNEKDKSEVADTVGCCSLRVEHLGFTEAGKKVSFDFLGKDSMRYFNEVEMSDEVGRMVFKNLKEFCTNKKKDEEIFDRLTTTSLNEHLKSLMPGLTAKVFRTFNASVTLEKELKQTKPEIKTDDTVNDKILFYNKANREVAILCNHQRSVPKAFEAQLGKLVEKQTEIEEQRQELVEHIAYITGKSKTKPKKRVKKEKKPEELPATAAGTSSTAAAAAGGDSKDSKSKSKKEKDDDDDDEPKALPTEPDRARAMLARIEKRLDDFRTKIALKQDTKTVALGTSKINYMDPRITVAWCKAKHVPIEKIFNKSLLSKFPWAMEVLSTWSF